MTVLQRWEPDDGPAGLRRDTLADQVAQRIVEQIETLGLRPGDELPPEAELARRFGVNRLAVREAIRTLAAREILVSSQGRPARVTTPSGRVFGQLLDFLHHQRALDFADLLDTRRVLETELARRAATQVRRGEASVADAAGILDRMSAHLGNRDTFVALDVAFHSELARAAASPTLQLILESLETVLFRARQRTYDGRHQRGLGQSPTVTAHRAILDAVAAGDADAAATQMAAHLAATAADLQSQHDDPAPGRDSTAAPDPDRSHRAATAEPDPERKRRARRLR